MTTNRALIFVHFDKDGTLDRYVLHALKAYRPHFARIVFVSPSLSELPLEAVELIDQFVTRENVGYDFGSWRDGMNALRDEDSFDEVFFLNDSVYGPLFDIAPVLGFGMQNHLDFWGMVLSVQSPWKSPPKYRPHIQSWFFVASRKVMASATFESFWRDVKQLPTKKEIVHRYEIGMSENLVNAGFSVGAVFDAREVEPIRWCELREHIRVPNLFRMLKQFGRARRLNYNPSELRFERLWEKGVPFLKSSIFRTNHYALDQSTVLRRLAEYSEYDPRNILDHQRRLAGRA